MECRSRSAPTNCAVAIAIAALAAAKAQQVLIVMVERRVASHSIERHQDSAGPVAEAERRE